LVGAFAFGPLGGLFLMPERTEKALRLIEGKRLMYKEPISA